MLESRGKMGLGFLWRLWLALFLWPWVLLIVALVAFSSEDVGDPDLPPAAVGIGVSVLSLLGLGLVIWARRRKLDTSAPEALAASYRGSLLLGAAFAEWPAGWAFVGVAVGREMWILLPGLAASVIGLLLVAPSRANLDRRQVDVTASGSALSLVETLDAVPPGRLGPRGSSNE
jgi:hypothetical protein